MKDDWLTLPAGEKYLFVKPAAIGKREPACRIKFKGQVYEAREIFVWGSCHMKECSAAEAGARIAVVTEAIVRYKP